MVVVYQVNNLVSLCGHTGRLDPQDLSLMTTTARLSGRAGPLLSFHAIVSVPSRVFLGGSWCLGTFNVGTFDSILFPNTLYCFPERFLTSIAHRYGVAVACFPTSWRTTAVIQKQA